MIKNITKNKVLAKNYVIKNSLFSQAIGLMFRKKQTNALFNFYIEKNWNITTFFMLFPIDILFLNKDKQVTKISRNVRPWKPKTRGYAKYVIELPAGKAFNTEKGDRISFK